MKKVTELSTPESIINQISLQDIPEFRASLREMMDGYFLKAASDGINPEPAYCSYKAVDSMLEQICTHRQTASEVKQAAGM